jgi:D-alanine-D-alanine ligase
MVCALTLHKAMAKRVIRDHRLPTPDFVLVESPADITGIRLRPPLIAKPVAEGTSKGITTCSVIRSTALLRQICLGLLEDYGQPVLVERFLPGREFTTGIVGTGAAARAVGTIEVLLRPGADADVYSYRNKEHCEELVQYRLLEEAPLRATVEQLAVSSWRALGCRDAGRVDIRCDAGGRPQFLEANPLAGLHPEHSDLPIICALRQIPYRDLMRWIIGSAAERIQERGSERISSAA